MAIFKIEPIINKQELKEEQTEAAKVPPAVPETDETDAVAAQSVVNGTQPEQTDEPFALTRTVDESAPKMLVKVNGPIGAIFTEALNRVLSVESMMATALPAVYDEDARLVKQNYPKHKVIHVHVVNGDRFGIPELIDIQKEIVKDELADTVIAVENANLSDSQQFKYLCMARNLNKGTVKVRMSVTEAAEQVGYLIRSR